MIKGHDYGGENDLKGKARGTRINQRKERVNLRERLRRRE